MNKKLPILIISKIKGNLKKPLRVKKLLKNLGLSSYNNFILINHSKLKKFKKLDYLIDIKQH